MIEIKNISKRYGHNQVLQNVSFSVLPGRVTGFLGPNGAGKSTVMRILLGLDSADSGEALINGKPYRQLPNPLSVVGALLDARSVHPRRTAQAHLDYLALTHGIDRKRVAEVAELTGLSTVLKRRVGKFSLGMQQRLGVAAALLGDPEVLILDEPVNGLDPEGMRWIRDLLKYLAGENRTIFVSSHLMAEMQNTADEVIVIGRGKIHNHTDVNQLRAIAGQRTIVRAKNIAALRPGLAAAGMELDPRGGDEQTVVLRGAVNEAVGQLALAAGVALTELWVETASLEEAYFDATESVTEFRAKGGDHA